MSNLCTGLRLHHLLIIVMFYIAVLKGDCLPISDITINFPLGKTVKYKYVTESILRGENITKSTNFMKNMGFGLSAIVHLTNVWSKDSLTLIKLEVNCYNLSFMY